MTQSTRAAFYALAFRQGRREVVEYLQRRLTAEGLGVTDGEAERGGVGSVRDGRRVVAVE